jgi:NADH dehydrogenase
VYFAAEGGATLTPFSTYDYKVGSTRGALAGLANLAYQFNANNRLSVQGFSTNKGKRETRTFEGYNDDAARDFRNARLLWEEESLRTVQLTGEHFFPAVSNSRLDWRALNERGSDGSGFQRVHVTLAETMIAACKASGVPRILQMSALRAGEGASHYLRTRFDADSRVRDSRLAWTIFRPSVMFGRGDGLFFRFASLLRIAPALPLARPDARFAPVHVGDVAEAFARALVHPHSIGHSYELFGPRTLTLRELVRWTAELIDRRRWIIGLPDALGYVQARVGEWLPGKPISRDNFRSLLIDSVGERDGLGELGIVSTPMELIVPAMLGADPRQHRLDRFREEHRSA